MTENSRLTLGLPMSKNLENLKIAVILFSVLSFASCSSALKLTKSKANSKSSSKKQVEALHEQTAFSPDGSIDYKFKEAAFEGIEVSGVAGTCDGCELVFTLIDSPMELTNSNGLRYWVFFAVWFI